MMRIYLTGYMGSGKTTIGKKLTTNLGFLFIDLDKLIENKYRITIPDIFSRYDENAFRLVEHKTLQDTFTMNNVVISTGGGTPCFYNNMSLINQHGYSVYIQMHVKSLYNRLINSKKKRPLLADKSAEEIMDLIREQLTEREPHYLQSNLVIKGESMNINKLVESIANHIKQSG
jgi:shikimate kinase